MRPANVTVGHRGQHLGCSTFFGSWGYALRACVMSRGLRSGFQSWLLLKGCIWLGRLCGTTLVHEVERAIEYLMRCGGRRAAALFPVSILGSGESSGGIPLPPFGIDASSRISQFGRGPIVGIIKPHLRACMASLFFSRSSGLLLYRCWLTNL